MAFAVALAVVTGWPTDAELVALMVAEARTVALTVAWTRMVLLYLRLAA